MLLASEICKEGISISDSFKNDLGYVVLYYRPKNIIETGTYNGLGSTSALLNALDENKEPYKLYSIESNIEYFKAAQKNLSKWSIQGKLILINSLSIPGFMIPKEIESVPENIITDHKDSNDYLKESQNFEQEDALKNAFVLCENKPDLILLDSGGHLGFIEFKYLLTFLESDCIIALDDVKHRKHYKSLEYIKANPDKFTIIIESGEKFGHAIVKYNHSENKLSA